MTNLLTTAADPLLRSALRVWGANPWVRYQKESTPAAAVIVGARMIRWRSTIWFAARAAANTMSLTTCARTAAATAVKHASKLNRS